MLLVVIDILDIAIICEQFSHLVHIRQSLSQLLAHIFCCLICSDTHWMVVVTDNILNESLIGTLTKKNTNSRVLMGFTNLVIKYFHVRLQLTYIGRFKCPFFKLHYNHTIQFSIEKK